jgi:hypothetical protein
MSRNSKNARRIAAAKALPKNRSAAARARRAEGKPATNGRGGKQSTKKNAWWQKFPTYGAYLRGGKKQKAED